MTRGSSGDREVEHLTGKDGGGQDTHEWNLSFAQIPANSP